MTSFAGGLGLLNTDPTKGVVFPLWASLLLLAVLLFIGSLVVAVQWPLEDWCFGLHPQLLLAEARALPDDVQGLKRKLSHDMGQAMADNDTRIRSRSRLLRLAAGSLVVEGAVFVAAIVTVS